MAYSSYTRQQAPDLVPEQRAPRRQVPALDDGFVRTTWTTSLQLMNQAEKLDPSHRRKDRRKRRLLRARRRFLQLLLLAAVVVVAWYVPWSSWWAAVQEASTSSK